MGLSTSDSINREREKCLAAVWMDADTEWNGWLTFMALLVACLPASLTERQRERWEERARVSCYPSLISSLKSKIALCILSGVSDPG